MTDPVEPIDIEEPDEAELAKIQVKEEKISLSDISDDPVRMYLKEIGRVPLLSSDEEMRLATRMAAANYTVRVRDQLQGRDGYPPQESDVLFHIYQEMNDGWQDIAGLCKKLKIEPHKKLLSIANKKNLPNSKNLLKNFALVLLEVLKLKAVKNSWQK